MEVAEILGQFERLTGRFPRAAVEAAIEQREAVIPELLRVLEGTLDRARELTGDNKYTAHFYAAYLLAQFRERRAYPLMVRMALLPSDVLEDLCGDFVGETLGRGLASVCGGDLDGIKSVIENEAADEWARGAAIGALVTLVNVGEKSRDEIIGYFADLFRGGLKREPSWVWDELVSSSCDLWPQELLADIELAFAEELIDETVVCEEDVHHDLAKGMEELLANLARSPHHRLIDDTVKEFGWWACFQPQKAQRDFLATKGSSEAAKEPHATLPAGFAPILKDAPKTGRNEPCPCGSGKKYKKCCLQ